MKRIYLIGICGTGMSALAGLFKENGYIVGGSDNGCYSPIKEEIENLNLNLYRNFSAENIKKFKPDLIIVGNIVGRGNPEGEFILNENYPFMSMPQALFEFFLKNKKRIVIAGTHGKTTTASFVSFAFEKAGLSPGFFIGGIPINFKKNYKTGKGEYFIIEGDEYETSFFDKYSKFFHYFPTTLILKPLEFDHTDIFESEKEYLKAFRFLLREVPANGGIFFPSSSKKTKKLLNHSFSKNILYGKEKDTDISYTLKKNSYPYIFNVKIGEIDLGEFQLNLIGEYNIENILPGIYLLLKEKIKIEKIKEIVREFKGVKRRQEILFISKRITIIDDFAHHPTAIKKTIESVKKAFAGKSLLTIFEPASWSLRKKTFEKNLIKALADTDIAYILDIKNKERIPKKERLELNIIKKELEKKGIKVLLFENEENNKGSVIYNLRKELKERDLTILILSNSTCLNLNEHFKSEIQEKL